MRRPRFWVPGTSPGMTIQEGSDHPLSDEDALALRDAFRYTRAMIAFWAMAGVISAVAATLILFRAAGAARATDAGDTTGVFYRRQLAEIGDLADRGLLEAGERKSAEAEAGRRLLAAADAPLEAWSTSSNRAAVLIAAIAAPAVALGLYFAVGAPGMADQPFEGRLKQWMAANPETLTPQQMAAVLSRMAPQHPHDPEGYRFLALAEGASNNPAGAVVALKKAVRIAPGRADLWEMLGEAMIYQDGGRISDDARDAFIQTLKRDPTSVAARFNLGRARLAAGDRAGGLADWRALLAAMPAADQRRAAVQAAIDEAQGAPAPPPALNGDQMTAVRGMVAGLAERLSKAPDDPQGWVRLVRAYAVLGETAKREAALREASTRYANKPEILDQLSKAAQTEPMRAEPMK